MMLKYNLLVFVVILAPLIHSRSPYDGLLIVSVHVFTGKVLMAPLLQLLLKEFGYRWACLLAGALSLHTCVTGMLFHPPAWHKVLLASHSVSYLILETLNEMRVVWCNNLLLNQALPL